MAEKDWADLLVAVCEKFDESKEDSAPLSSAAFFSEISERLTRGDDKDNILQEAFRLLDENGEYYKNVGLTALGQLQVRNVGEPSATIGDELSKKLDGTQSFLDEFKERIIEVGETNSRHLEKTLKSLKKAGKVRDETLAGVKSMLLEQNANSSGREAMLEGVSTVIAKIEQMLADQKQMLADQNINTGARKTMLEGVNTLDHQNRRRRHRCEDRGRSGAELRNGRSCGIDSDGYCWLRAIITAELRGL
jgi:hypothetical protein